MNRVSASATQAIAKKITRLSIEAPPGGALSFAGADRIRPRRENPMNRLAQSGAFRCEAAHDRGPTCSHGGATMVARLRPMKRMSRTWPAIAEPSLVEKWSGVQSLIADSMDWASAESSALPPLDRVNTILGSPITAPSRVKLTRTVTWSSSCGGRQQAASPVAMPWTPATSGRASTPCAGAPSASVRTIPIQAKRQAVRCCGIEGTAGINFICIDPRSSLRAKRSNPGEHRAPDVLWIASSLRSSQ